MRGRGRGELLPNDNQRTLRGRGLTPDYHPRQDHYYCCLSNLISYYLVLQVTVNLMPFTQTHSVVEMPCGPLDMRNYAHTCLMCALQRSVVSARDSGRVTVHFTFCLMNNVTWSCAAYLVPEDPYGAGGGHLLRAEPHRGDFGRHPQDEDLSAGAAELAQEGDRKQVWTHTGHFDPGPGAV